MKWCLMIKGEVTRGWLLRRIMEGEIIRNIRYMIIDGKFTLVIKDH